MLLTPPFRSLNITLDNLSEDQEGKLFDIAGKIILKGK